MSRVGRLVAAVAVVAATVAFPAPAGALTIPFGNSCKENPPVDSPGSGTPGIFDASPADTGGGPPRTEYERYGYAGLRWAVYDPGCPGNARQPAAVIDTYLGNLALGLASDLAALGAGIHRVVDPPSFLHAFDHVTLMATRALHDKFYLAFLPLSLMILGLFIIGKSHRRDLPGTVRMAGWALVVMTIATLAFAYPTRIGGAADKVETKTVSMINGALAGSANAAPSAAGSLEVSGVLYPAWLRGELGRDTGPIADTYGPKLLDGQAYTWAEAANPAKAPDKGKEFAAAASAVHDKDQGAYDHLKGQAGGRLGAGVYALFGVLLTVPFRMAADLLVVASLIILRIAVVFAPALAVVGLHAHFSGLIRTTLMAVGAALVNAVVFSAAAAVNTLAVGTLLSPSSGIPQWFGLILCGLLAVVLWFALKPYRRLTQMVSRGHSPVREAAEGFGRAKDRAGEFVGDRLAAAKGAIVGAATGGPTGAVAGAIGGADGARREAWSEPLSDEQPAPSTPKTGPATGPIQPPAAPEAPVRATPDPHRTAVAPVQPPPAPESAAPPLRAPKPAEPPDDPPGPDQPPADVYSGKELEGAA